MALFAELKRRNVVRVGIAYAIASWLLLQVVDIVIPVIEAPDWVQKSILLLIAIGFPIALIVAWAFELTPEGLKFERDVDRSQSVTATTGRKLDFIIIAVLVVALGFFALDKFVWSVQPGEFENSDTRSIAVLPFINMSGDPEQLYFSDGISEEILNALVRVDSISVASRTSSFTYRSEDLVIPEIAEALDVLFILEGSVRKAGERIRITAQLIDASEDRHLWSEVYDRDLSDIFAVQSEIANAIAQAVSAELDVEVDVNIPVRKLTENMDAYDLYLKGHNRFSRRNSAQHIIESIDYLERAIELDPEFAAAWETLAAAYSVAPFWGRYDMTVGEYLGLSDAAADRALEIDPDLAFPLAIKGSNTSSLPPFDMIGAMRFYEASIEKDPANPTVLNWMGINYLLGGYFDQGIVTTKKCLEVDPLYMNCLGWLRNAYNVSGQTDKAAETTLKILNVSDELSLTFSLSDTAMFVTEGNMVAALISAHMLDGLEGSPHREFIAALENPEADHSRGLKMYEKWADENGVDLQNYPAILAIFGDYERVDMSHDTDIWFWLPMYEKYRRSDEFKTMMADGIVAWWKEKGFPPQCRPIGDDDFECD